ncbi:uncharacterized protein I303_101441 [Kwoniella dejecticola CBS 10117]|uniref:Uncharacterized protein n=1 Tax=Kwoniella dejecticola CBS 10117 TaxID=1296121 RepID=A0A1A6AHR8_9TREE|nr:uncharacterized protein I303_01451 [Kwoniella dejecticola CBS 10117]OBR89622.1 hypothetical protein I303_01451 [Kwoniella dejecticola CBS 10117]
MALKHLILDAGLTIKRRALQCNIGPDGGISDCLSAITQLVDQVEVIGNAGMLIYLHDITACTLSEVTTLMYKYFWKLSVNQKSLVVSLIKRINQICVQVTGGSDNSATAFIARFTQKALKSLSIESRAPSPTAQGENDVNRTGDDYDFLKSLDEFVHTSATQDDLTQEDQQFWLSLFAPTGTETDMFYLGDLPGP